MTPRIAIGCTFLVLWATSCAKPAPTPGVVDDEGPAATSLPITAAVEFPEPLQGFWVSVAQACTDDTEAAMRITSDELVGYEEIRRPVTVEAREDAAPAWTIGTEVDIGVDGDFAPSGPVKFTLEGDELVSDYKPFATRYRRCTPSNDADPHGESRAWAEYPEAIRGEWAGQEAGCLINHIRCGQET